MRPYIPILGILCGKKGDSGKRCRSFGKSSAWNEARKRGQSARIPGEVRNFAHDLQVMSSLNFSLVK